MAAPLVARFESVRSLVFAARVFNALNMVGVLWLLRRILRRLYPEVAWQFPILLLLASFMFVRNSIEFRPDPAMNFALYAAVLHWLAFLQEGHLRRAVAAGLLFGLAIAILQKALVIFGLVAAAAAILLVSRRRRREAPAKLALGLSASIGTSTLIVAALYAAMSRLGIFDDFWFWNYPFNRFFYLQADLPEHFSLARAIGRSVLLAPVLWLAAAGGACSVGQALRSAWPFAARDECRFTLLLAAAGYVGFLCCNRFPLDQYLIVLLPLLAIFAAELMRAPDWRGRRWLEPAILAMPLVLVAGLLLYPNNEEQLRLQGFVLWRTSENQPVFVPPAFNPIFRRDAAYFWYNGELIGKAYEQYCRRAGHCANDKTTLDEKRWASSPPAFVFLEEPGHYPYHWSARSSSYNPSLLPGLWERGSKWASAPASERAPPARLP